MSRRDKTLSKWKNNLPKEVRRQEVEAILKYYFPGKYRLEKSSHIVLQHDDLINIEPYKPYGEITIPCKQGKFIKGFYIKKLLKVIEILGLWEERGGKS